VGPQFLEPFGRLGTLPVVRTAFAPWRRRLEHQISLLVEPHMDVLDRESVAPQRASRPGVPRLRGPIDVAVSENSEHAFYTTLLEEGPASGLFVATHVPHRVGRQLDFVIALDDDGDPFVGVGVVKWIRQYSETSDAPPGMGIEFRELAPGALERIRTFLLRRAPLLHDDPSSSTR